MGTLVGSACKELLVRVGRPEERQFPVRRISVACMTGAEKVGWSMAGVKPGGKAGKVGWAQAVMDRLQNGFRRKLLLLLSRFSRVQLCVTPQTAAHQAPPSLGFSRQEYWSGLPFPPPMHESEK